MRLFALLSAAVMPIMVSGRVLDYSYRAIDKAESEGMDNLPDYTLQTDSIQKDHNGIIPSPSSEAPEESILAPRDLEDRAVLSIKFCTGANLEDGGGVCSVIQPENNVCTPLPPKVQLKARSLEIPKAGLLCVAHSAAKCGADLQGEYNNGANGWEWINLGPNVRLNMKVWDKRIWGVKCYADAKGAKVALSV